MTIAEAAERYGTDAAGIWEMVAAGTLVAIREPDQPWRVEEVSCPECHASAGHRPDCSRRLGGHARGCAEALTGGNRVRARGLHALIPTGEAVDLRGYHPASPRAKLRALSLDEDEPPLAAQEIVDRVISSLVAEDARARSCLPPSPQGYHWDAALDVRPNGSAAQGEVRLRIAYRLVEDE